jgi:hypothetical protein
MIELRHNTRLNTLSDPLGVSTIDPPPRAGLSFENRARVYNQIYFKNKGVGGFWRGYLFIFGGANRWGRPFKSLRFFMKKLEGNFGQILSRVIRLTGEAGQTLSRGIRLASDRGQTSSHRIKSAAKHKQTLSHRIKSATEYEGTLPRRIRLATERRGTLSHRIRSAAEYGGTLSRGIRSAAECRRTFSLLQRQIHSPFNNKVSC